MSGNDGNVKIGTEIDQSGIDKGLKETEAKLKKSGKDFKKSFADMRDIMQGPVAAGKMIVQGIQKVIAVVNDLTDAYKTQQKAETQLEAAARNNPFLSSSNVQSLKDYASELQGISTFGDEELIPFMAQLASAGRTQDEIMKIMAASVDIAASGAMSLDSAVRNLNKSFGGLAGELGETVPEIKALTQEELKQGGAVDILAKRYKGMAKEVAQTTGSGEQLKNAWGDLKEELGAPFEKGLSPVRAFFTELISGWAEAKKKKREYEEGTEAISEGSTQSADFEKALAGELTKLTYLQEELETYRKYLTYSDAELSNMGYIREDVERLIKDANVRIYQQTIMIKKLESQVSTAKMLESATLAVAEAAKKAADATAARAELDAKAWDYIEANRKAREQALEVLRLEAELTGGKVDDAEVLAIYQKSYVDLLTQSNGLVTANNQAAKGLLAEIMALAEEYKPILDAQKAQAELTEDIAELTSALNEIQRELSDGEVLQQQLAQLDIQYNAVINNALLTAEQKEKIDAEYAEKKQILEESITKAERAEQQERLDSYMEIVNEFATQYASIMASIVELGNQQIEAESAAKIAMTEDQYAKGLLSADEYNARLAEIDKETAEKKYKLDMWRWSSDMLSAVANTAMGVTKALADGGALGIITGALVAAAGAAQIAVITANKPRKPQFADGGIVPGTSYTGDRVEALVNSGEMILNAAQQRRLFNAIDRGEVANGAQIKVYNSAANDVRATPEVTEDGVKIMIRKVVSQDMADGRFNGSYKAMQSRLRGTRYTN